MTDTDNATPNTPQPQQHDDPCDDISGEYLGGWLVTKPNTHDKSNSSKS